MKTDRTTTFRVFFAGGAKMEVDAANPDQARKAAQKTRGGIITKVKALREPDRRLDGTVERRDA